MGMVLLCGTRSPVLHAHTHRDGPIQQRRRFLCVVGKWKHANPLWRCVSVCVGECMCAFSVGVCVHVSFRTLNILPSWQRVELGDYARALLYCFSVLLLSGAFNICLKLTFLPSVRQGRKRGRETRESRKGLYRIAGFICLRYKI